LLGIYNDTTVGIAWLHSFASGSDAPRATILAAGALLQSVNSHGLKLRRQCLKAWNRFDRSEVLEDAVGEIRQTATKLAAAERKAAEAARAAAARAAASVATQPDQQTAVTEPQAEPSAPTLQLAAPAEIKSAVETATADEPADSAASDESETKPNRDPDDTEHAA
jgi:hypothetical protein